jgi:hypothetical protein
MAELDLKRYRMPLVPVYIAVAIAALITIAGVLYLVRPAVPTEPTVTNAARDRAVAAGRLWQAQRNDTSLHVIRLERMKEGAVETGRAWEAKRGQQSLFAIRLDRMQEAAVLNGIEWQVRHEQTTPARHRN